MKLNLKPVTMFASKHAGRLGLLAKKHAPEILFVIGIGGMIYTIVDASKATMKLTDLKYHHEDKIAEIYDRVNVENVEVDDKEIGKEHVRYGLAIAKNYARPAIVFVLSASALAGSHGLLKKRNIALMAAYKLLDEDFTKYRKNVVAELGEAKDEHFRGLEHEIIEVEEEDDNGKKKKGKKDVKIVGDPNGHSQYARFFDESSPNWNQTPEYNLYFLKAQQNYWNDMLRARGHVFLNEVYESLGMSHSKAGAVVGWVLSKDDGDNFIDFGIYENKDAVNGKEKSWLLDFNVDGVIYDLI